MQTHEVTVIKLLGLLLNLFGVFCTWVVSILMRPQVARRALLASNFLDGPTARKGTLQHPCVMISNIKVYKLVCSKNTVLALPLLKKFLLVSKHRVPSMRSTYQCIRNYIPTWWFLFCSLLLLWLIFGCCAGATACCVFRMHTPARSATSASSSTPATSVLSRPSNHFL